MYILFSNLLLIAESKENGRLVAPKTKTPSSLCPTPFIWTKNSVLTLLDASFSPSDLAPQTESISSINIIDGFFFLAISNKDLINFSDSPTYFEIILDAEIEKNVASVSVAQALAIKDLPVPGGPYNNIPFQGLT